jgi:DNA-binding GntR family transcriptional regulator
MMQNGRAVTTHPSVVRDLAHRFELRAVLECDAVRRAALSPNADVQPAWLLLLSAPRAWDRLELAFHRLVNEQSGNSVLAAMAERSQREIHDIVARHTDAVDYPLHALHDQHRAILRCIDGGQADLAVQYTLAHLDLLREHMVLAVNGRRAAALARRR